MNTRIFSELGCENCANLIHIGEGDHICFQCTEPIMPISEWFRTEDYYKCKGKSWQEQHE